MRVGLRTIGLTLLAAGAFGMAAAFAYPVTIAPDPAAHGALIDSLRGMTSDQARATLLASGEGAPVANLDRMATRSMLHLTAAAVMVAGAVLAAFGGRRADRPAS